MYLAAGDSVCGVMLAYGVLVLSLEQECRLERGAVHRVPLEAQAADSRW